MKLNKQQLKTLSFIIIVFNLISIILGILYYAVPTTILFWLWNLTGIIMFISWLLNTLLIYVNDRIVMKSDTTGKKINLLCYGFLVFIIITMLLLFFNTLTLSFIANISILITSWALLSIIGVAIFGIILAYMDIKNLVNRGVWKFE